MDAGTIGRDAEIAEVSGLLLAASGAPVAMAITGDAGIGKTAETEAALVGGAYLASGSTVTAPLVAPLLTAAEGVPSVGGGLVAGAVVGNPPKKAPESWARARKRPSRPERSARC